MRLNMDSSVLEEYKKIYKAQEEQITLLKKQVSDNAEAMKTTNLLIKVQDLVINVQKQQISQLTRTHLKVVK